MNYTSSTHIQTVEDVKTFFHHLIDERKVNFHPDDDFRDYSFYADGKPAFTEQEANVYNRLMGEAIDVCEKAHADIYGIGFEMMMDLLGRKTA